MQVKKDQVYTDLKYGCDVVIKEIKDEVVWMKEIDSGNNRLSGYEEFSEDKKRFVPTQ